MNGAELITEERKRQVEAEGWTPEHDNDHDLGELIGAAICYMVLSRRQVVMTLREDEMKVVPHDWPWDKKWWKPSLDDPKRNLVKAASLIAAEIDRIVRKEDCA